MRRIEIKGDITTDTGFMARVAVSDSGCWEWLGALFNGGYGRVKRGGKDRLAHVYAFEQRKGIVPAGLQLDHLCRNRKCVNPDHLEAVTARENQRRGNTFTRTKLSQTHCVHGHSLSGENLYVRPNGKRLCRTCHRTKTAAYSRRPEAKKRHAELERIRRQKRGNK